DQHGKGCRKQQGSNFDNHLLPPLGLSVELRLSRRCVSCVCREGRPRPNAIDAKDAAPADTPSPLTIHRICGFFVRHVVACSYAWAARRTVSSSNARPMICNPIGRPARLNPQGSEIAGIPARLTEIV